VIKKTGIHSGIFVARIFLRKHKVTSCGSHFIEEKKWPRSTGVATLRNHLQPCKDGWGAEEKHRLTRSLRQRLKHLLMEERIGLSRRKRGEHLFIQECKCKQIGRGGGYTLKQKSQKFAVTSMENVLFKLSIVERLSVLAFYKHQR
jgi:hypothetical protein